MTIRQAIHLLKPYRKRLIVIAIYAIIISIISAVSPFINSMMIDNGLLQGNIPVVIQLVIALILLLLLDRIVQYLQRVQEIEITNSLGKKLKVEAFRHGLRLKPLIFKEKGFYKTMSDALYDISNIMVITDNSLLTILVILFKFLGAAIGLVVLDWRLALLIAVLIPLKVAFNLVMCKQSEKLGDQLMGVYKTYNTWFSDMISGVFDIKLWNLDRKKADEYEAQVGNINKATKKLSLFTAKYNALVQMIELVIMNSMYIVGAFLIVGEQLTLGNLFAFISFSSFLLTPINAIMNLRVILKQITPSVQGYKRFMSLEEENYEASLKLATPVSSIVFRNVCVAFDGRHVLSNLNLEIHRGEKIAIVGDNGSGKTTMINLLMRLIEPDSGEIFIDDIPIQEYNIEDYRAKFSIVTQNIHLFQGTIKENITLGKYDDLQFHNAELTQFCTETIEKWEDNYNTIVGNDGQKLSGGERQKIALLRALHHSASILILDEPTSNFDTKSQQGFNQFLQRSDDFDFYILITHDSSIFPYLDRIYRLENGSLRSITNKEQEADVVSPE